MIEPTSEQRAAISARGKVIVSASAGSGKTFVMIKKLADEIAGGAELDGVLAVTFTKKAAAQMKEKLRAELISRVEKADGALKAHLKVQLSKINSAAICTIHSLCSRLLRTYFYALGIDGGFTIMAEGDAESEELKTRAVENLFERKYASDDAGFYDLLSCFSRKRSDASFKKLVLASYASVRTVCGYKKLLESAEELYSDNGFKAVCKELSDMIAAKYRALRAEVENFAENFPETANKAIYMRIFEEMETALKCAEQGGIFAPLPALSSVRKPVDGEQDKEAGEKYKAFRAEISKKYFSARGDIASEAEEERKFLQSGRTAAEFSKLLSEFDDEYFSVKTDENKLDYNDLEHLTLKLLEDKDVLAEINGTYKRVFVDEYQDVNPVQEAIISAFTRESFLVGDVKQAIYGFRGSKSLFFAEKYSRYLSGDGEALRLSENFRSCKKVIDFVNGLFSVAMRESICGFDFTNNSEMTASGAYPPESGLAQIAVFGKERKEERKRGVYSVKDDGRSVSHTREGLAALKIVENELKSKRYDPAAGGYVDIQPGDICILTRKNGGGSAEGITRALKDAGYQVSGVQETNICRLPEVKKIIDILSLIDNAEQDVPLVTALLSPIGGLTENDLATVRVALKREKKLSFRECCAAYAAAADTPVAAKLKAFYEKLSEYVKLAEILTAGELIDKILADAGYEAAYSAGNGEKLAAVLRLAAEGDKLPLAAFLAKIKAGGYNIPAPAAAPSDSIKVMTMHAAKGLEFPVVIISDICRTFKGADYSELPFDDKYGFAAKRYDRENMTFGPTVLSRLCKLRADREELKNELNLFYVACTRAMNKLYVLAEEEEEYSAARAAEARAYSQTFDMSRLPRADIGELTDFDAHSGPSVFIGEADKTVKAEICSRFMREYAYSASVDLPVKSSASAIMRMRDGEPYSAEKKLFGGEGETGTERGTAYHRFLELCDFSLKDEKDIARELSDFVAEGLMPAGQAALVAPAEAAAILAMPAFASLNGAEIYREREFLCMLSARDALGEPAEDGVLVQGAIDLLIKTPSGWKIVDYKYSGKSDEELILKYSPQLALYKKAVAAATGADEKHIETSVINIFRLRQIDLP